MPPPDPAPALTVSDIKTELGNEVLEWLLGTGWVVEYEYPLVTFDKGIDFDAYTLVKDGTRVEFEWTNWDEWLIRGPRLVVRGICEEFAIEMRGEDS